MKVTANALIKRINRKLKKQDEVLKTVRENSRLIYDLGRHYVPDIRRNFIIHRGVDLETLGRELGVLHELETL